MYIDQNNLQDAIPKYDPYKVRQEWTEAEKIQDQKYKEETEPRLRKYIKEHPFMDIIQVPKVLQFFGYEPTKLSWYDISTKYFLSDNFIRDFHDKLNLVYVCEHQSVSEDIMREFQDEIGWDVISKYQTLSEDFIEEFADKVNWRILSETQTHLSEEFLEKHKDKWYWPDIFPHRLLSEQFLRNHVDEITQSDSWYEICLWHRLPEQFYRDYADKLNDDCWEVLADKDFLSEQFFIDYADKFKKDERKTLILCDGDKQNTQQIVNKNGVSIENISEVPANTTMEELQDAIAENRSQAIENEDYEALDL